MPKIRPVVLWPSPVLSTPSAIVIGFDAVLAELLEDMAATMVCSEIPAVGLAAPQVEVSARAVVIRAPNASGGIPMPVKLQGRRLAQLVQDKVKVIEMINPSFTPDRVGSAYMESCQEGCLSVPREYGQVRRYQRGLVKYQDREGEPHEMVATNFFAQVVQHEINHLDGIILPDHFSAMRRDALRAKAGK